MQRLRPFALVLALILVLTNAGCRRPAAAPSALATPRMLPLSASDWPQWRGPARDGVSKESDLLSSWPAGGPKQLWIYRELGAGYGGPAVAGGRIFIAGSDGKKELLFCLLATSAEKLWVTPIGDFYKNDMGSGPRATPTVDGDRVYMMGGRGDLICASARDGKLLWRREMSEVGAKAPSWGFSESVLVDGNQVVCTPGAPGGTMLALDKMTGATLWQSKEITEAAHYSSIMPMDLNGTRQYVQVTKYHVFGIDSKNGKLLWQQPFPSVTVVSTPIVRAPYVYVSAGQGVGCLLVKIGADNQPEKVYETKLMKNHHGGLVLLGDHLYGHSDPGGWICQEFLTGERFWAERSGLRKGSLTAAGGRLYCVDEDKGEVVLADASPAGWHEISRFTLAPLSTQREPSGKLWTHPVVANGLLFLRDQELLFCYDVRSR